MSFVSNFERRDFVPAGKTGKPVRSPGSFKCAPTMTSSAGGDEAAPCDIENLCWCYVSGGFVSLTLNDSSGASLKELTGAASYCP